MLSFQPNSLVGLVTSYFASITVSSMLGHSSAGFTLATYTHATNKAQAQAAAKMGGLLKQVL